MANQRIIYCDRLDVFVGLRLLLYSIRKPVTQVHFNSATKAGQLFLRFACKFAGVKNFERYDIDYSSSMPGGGGLYYWVHEFTIEISKKISQRIMDRDTFLDFFPGRIGARRRIGFIRKAVDIQVYPTILLTLIARQGLKSKYSNITPVIFTHLSDLLPFFVEAYDAGENIEYVNTIDVKDAVATWLYRFLVEQIKVIAIYLRNRFAKIQHEKGKHKPSVAIQYVWGVDHSFRINDLWWFEPSKIDNSRLVLFFSRSKQPATNKIINQLKDRGYRFAILEDTVNGTTVAKTDYYAEKRIQWVFRDLVSLLKIFHWIKHVHVPAWQAREWLIMMRRLRYWQAFMAAENTKVIFDVAETNRDIAALAADLVDGIKIGVHWSDHSHPRAMLLSLHHIYFVWGQHYQNTMREMGSVSNLVHIGNIYDSLEVRDQRKASMDMQRNKMKQLGVKYIFAIMDRSCSRTSHVPPDYHVVFYDKLLALVEQDSNLGLLIKPKRPTPAILDYRPDLNDRFQTAQDSGRVILLDGDRHVLEAGYASDLVVVLGPNSGGVICALQGNRVVSWDPSQASLSPQKGWINQIGWGDENIIHHKIDDLIKTLERFSETLSIDNQIGDFSKYLDLMDSFRDGKAGIRVGELVSEYLASCEKGLSSELALDAAFRVYGGKWGEETIDAF